MIRISFDHRTLASVSLIRVIRRCINAVLQAEGVDPDCEINVLLTDDRGIHAINKASRGIDRPTDVLSFPMFSLTPGELPEDWSAYLDPETGLCPLGDMAISLERARRQAAEYGHSVSREVGYLTIHSMLHLLGYDHLDEGPEKARMRAREEMILRRVNLNR
ncbi:MAG TPA: rRNA maturation RNase YbeY [Candidatus Faecousia faecigallinarum]|nr:rRNA maturation RNase YbeY [Candidatus Faecousia faecigallinarum]